MASKSEVKVIPRAVITTFEDFVQEQTLVVEAGVYAGEALLIRDKRELVGKPFLVVEWELRNSDTNSFVDVDGIIRARQYVCVVAMMDGGKGMPAERIVFNDGGTGIRPVLEQHEAKTGHRGGLLCKGLRVSEYEYKNPETGASSQARTFYLS